jgi:L-alanine-DL-glutamate epimerase-like enolase superfamily enzyme
MSKITSVECALVDLEPQTVRTDATQAFVKQETILVTLTTDDALAGTGYSYTIGTGGRAIAEMVREYLAPAVLGAGVITSLAMAGIDTALWDIRCLRAGEPLWRVAGGAHTQLPVYDTEGGWLHLSTEDLVKGARKSQAAGLRGVKVKVGKPSAAEDAERLAAVREAVGAGFEIMVDANQSLTTAEAIRRARSYEPLDIAWFEEPLPADDVAGHARLARSTSTPVAVGESIYSAMRFGAYLAAGAAGIVQADVARIGGITPWLKVAHAAEAFNVSISPHFLMELHVSLAAAVPNGMYVEYIPQLAAITSSSLAIVDGLVSPPSAPGLGIDWNWDAIDDYRVA